MMCLAEALLRIPDAHTADELIADKLVGAGLVGEARPVGFGLRQRRDLLAAADRQGAGRRAGPLGQLEGGAWPRGRAARRAGGAHGGARGDEDPRPQLRVRPDDRRSAEARRSRAAPGASATASTCSARRRRPSRMPSAMPRPIAERSTGSPRRRRAGFEKSPGISVKLTALHPRFEYTHRDEALAAVIPVVRELALKASKADVHFTIDAEEADRLELQMDVFEALLADDELFANGWGGLRDCDPGLSEARRAACATGSIEAARAHGRKLMCRLVKGAYWDTEIKAAQVGGLVRLSGVHPQGRDRRLLPRLRQEAARGERCHLSGLRDPQRQHDRPGEGAGRRARVRVPAPARHGRGAVRRNLPSSSGTSATRRRRCASTRRSAATRSCSPISSGGCSRTAPIRASSTASPTSRCRSTSWSAIRSPSSKRSSRSAIRRSSCRAICSARSAATAPGSTSAIRWCASRCSSG